MKATEDSVSIYLHTGGHGGNPPADMVEPLVLALPVRRRQRRREGSLLCWIVQDAGDAGSARGRGSKALRRFGCGKSAATTGTRTAPRRGGRGGRGAGGGRGRGGRPSPYPAPFASFPRCPGPSASCSIQWQAARRSVRSRSAPRKTASRSWWTTWRSVAPEYTPPRQSTLSAPAALRDRYVHGHGTHIGVPANHAAHCVEQACGESQRVAGDAAI